jgi:hypothetical protein
MNNLDSDSIHILLHEMVRLRVSNCMDKSDRLNRAIRLLSTIVRNPSLILQDLY